MNIKYATVATVFLLVSGCAQTGAVRPPSEPEVSSPIASAISYGSSTAMQPAPAG